MGRLLHGEGPRYCDGVKHLLLNKFDLDMKDRLSQALTDSHPESLSGSASLLRLTYDTPLDFLHLLVQHWLVGAGRSLAV